MIKVDHFAVVIAIGAIVILSIWPLSSGHGGGGHDDDAAHGDADHSDGGHGAPAHWSYAGPDGPEHWADLSGDFAACGTGRMQSPIDLTAPVGAPPPTLAFDYKPTPLDIVNNGHTVQVNYAPGSTMTVDGTAYALLQFHFHAPSEHSIAGVRAPMEVHFVHQGGDGTLAVLGVMIEAGAANQALAAVWANMPAEAGSKMVEGTMIDAAAVLPADPGNAFHYKGSLTTPPCSEGVRWFVAKTPIAIAAESVAAFEGVSAPNARPIQALNQRLLIASP